jgi:sigma-B regulation protein RsbU (phosphoserine phosphatase)
LEASGTASSPKINDRKDYLDALANAIAQFGQNQPLEQMLSEITSLLVDAFEAQRAELWLWDETSSTGYLTNAAGAEGRHHHDYIQIGKGPLGHAIEHRRSFTNLPLSGPDKLDFTSSSNLEFISVYPLVVSGRPIAVLALYTTESAAESTVQWWTMYAEVAGIAAQRQLAAAESQKQIQQLSLLFEATRLLNSTLDLAELLDLILRIAKTEVKAERGTVFLLDRQNKELWSIVAQGLESAEIRVPFDRGVAGHVVTTGEHINVADAYTLEYFDRSFDQKFNFRTKSLLCLPIRHRSNEIVGVIQLLNSSAGVFSAEDQEFLEKLSGHMAMALENARLHREALEKQRMERDLAVARNIQQSLLPQTPPTVAGYDIWVTNEPCFECGGDYYDFLSLGPSTLLAVVADVEGKGVASALVMSNLQATLRALSMHLHSLEVLMLSLNEMMFNDTKSEKYLSCFLALVDTKRNGLHYINAGHCPPILVSGLDGSFQKLEKGGTVVGLFPDVEYERGSAQMHPGDILVLSTDGITEACNINEDEFEAEGMAASVARHRHLPAKEIVANVLAEVNEFARGGPHVDDKVLMIIKVTEGGNLEKAQLR